MTILPMSVDGLAEIAAALRAGEAVVIPFASPLPYVVAGTRASTVNEAKGRPSGQPCGILVGAPEDVAAYLDLDAATVRLSMWIAAVERANVLVPVRPDAPAWLREGSVDGFAGLTLASLPQTRPIADRLGHLFVSSGNLTSRPAAVTAPGPTRCSIVVDSSSTATGSAIRTCNTGPRR
jgi:L-threonylcarbamoyladenylate synthase